MSRYRPSEAMARTKPPVSYSPPDLCDRIDGPVARRHVFYVPGYDPVARSRYRLLFVRELARYAKRFGEDKREIGRAAISSDGLMQSWTVAAHPATQGARTRYDVLLWDDLVARDFARPRLVSLALLFLGTSHALIAGKLAHFYRLNWKYGNIIVYPFVMMMMLAAAAAGIAASVHGLFGGWLAASLGLPGWASIALALLAGIGAVVASEALLNRIYFWQLVNDWVFNWQHGQGHRRDYEQRLDLFADRVLERLAALRQDEEPPDEIVIVGHSSGGLTAVEIAARLLDRDPGLGRDRTGLALVTLGSGLPLVALQPQAVRVRADIARIVNETRIVWIDYVANQDWLNFPHFNPVRDLDLPLAPGAPVANPTIRSARFREIIDDETYRKVRRRPFRMHFQFLMAPDRRGEYDFFAMTLGPRRVHERAIRLKPKHLANRAAREPRAA